MIKLFGFGLNEVQIERLEAIKKYMKHSVSQSIEIVDLRSFEPEINHNDIVITFGKKAHQRTTDKKSRYKIELPEVDQLDASLDKNKRHREEAFNKINKLIQVLSSNTSENLLKTITVKETGKILNLTEELPKELTTGEIKILEKQQREQGLCYWTGITTDGRSIKITIEPEVDTADINITFAELYAVIGLKEAFRVKELEFVYKPPSITRKGNT